MRCEVAAAPSGDATGGCGVGLCRRLARARPGTALLGFELAEGPTGYMVNVEKWLTETFESMRSYRRMAAKAEGL